MVIFAEEIIFCALSLGRMGRMSRNTALRIGRLMAQTSLVTHQGRETQPCYKVPSDLLVKTLANIWQLINICKEKSAK